MRKFAFDAAPFNGRQEGTVHGTSNTSSGGSCNSLCAFLGQTGKKCSDAEAKDRDDKGQHVGTGMPSEVASTAPSEGWRQRGLVHRSAGVGSDMLWNANFNGQRAGAKPILSPTSSV